MSFATKDHNEVNVEVHKTHLPEWVLVRVRGDIPEVEKKRRPGQLPAVIELMKGKHAVGTKMVSEGLGITRYHARKYLDELVRLGLAEELHFGRLLTKCYCLQETIPS